MFRWLWRLLNPMPQFSFWFKRIDARVERTLVEQREQNQLILLTLADIKSLLERLAFPTRAVKLLFNVVIDGVLHKGVRNLQAKPSQEFDVTLGFTDAQNNPATVQGVPVWTNSNDTIISMVPAADGLSAVIGGIQGTGTGQITVTADADLGDGVTDIIGILDVEIISGQATVITLNTGPLRDKTPTPTPTPTP